MRQGASPVSLLSIVRLAEHLTVVGCRRAAIYSPLLVPGIAHLIAVEGVIPLIPECPQYLRHLLLLPGREREVAPLEAVELCLRAPSDHMIGAGIVVPPAQLTHRPGKASGIPLGRIRAVEGAGSTLPVVGVVRIDLRIDPRRPQHLRRNQRMQAVCTQGAALGGADRVACGKCCVDYILSHGIGYFLILVSF